MWALLTLLLTAHPSAAQAETAIPQSGSTSVSAQSRKATAKVTIHTVRIDSSNSAFPSDWESDTGAVTIVKVMVYSSLIPDKVEEDTRYWERVL